ncbi:MAG: ribosomal L7Ae/L30e/S12e/Gadd45 family protein [Candidatus Woesearchaeota archaeon]
MANENYDEDVQEEDVEEEVTHKEPTLAEQLRVLLATQKLVFGKEMTLKSLKKNELRQIIVTKNIPEQVRSDVVHYAAIAKVDVTFSSLTNEELGILCKKPFAVSLLGIKK